MENKELLQLWKSYDEKLGEVLNMNKEIAFEITKKKLKDSFNQLVFPKKVLLIFGIPYTLFLCCLTFITFKAEATIMMLGFGAISLINICLIIGCLYHLFLISRINREEEVINVQKRIAELKLSVFNLTKLAVIQLPFWAVCWISVDVLKSSPLVYGGVNLLIFAALAYFSFWIYQKLGTNDNKISAFFLSGEEWEILNRSTNMLSQLTAYKNQAS